MKLKFKVQPYQTNAVEAAVDCFEGQPMYSELLYHNNFGSQEPDANGYWEQVSHFENRSRNTRLVLSESQILDNIRKVQRRQNLPTSKSLADNFTTYNNKGKTVPVKAAYKRGALSATNIHLDIEMETGTGKTYCYIKTIFEMNRRYGWSKFIIVVPSIAIREGVHKSLDITAEHFAEIYGKKARFFTYNSNCLHELESFSSNSGINIMIINVQAFFSHRKENRRIYDELDDFQSRRPIDVIAASRPILILDEPQKMEGKATLEALPKFNPLIILRYSATHRTQHNLIHRLDALDAYNQKLVKKIAVQGIQTRGLAGTNAYIYLEGIDISEKTPVARIELEVKLRNGQIKRQLRRLQYRDNLFDKSGKLDQYREGFVIRQIDYSTDTVEFTNGIVLTAGEAVGDISEGDIRRIQIRETIKNHLDREKQLFDQGIKVLSLFFIDEVKKYRDYDQEDTLGEYARIFEEEYECLKDEYLLELKLDNENYRKYLSNINGNTTHNGYFSIDKKTNRLKDPSVGIRTADSDDVDAYDLILKDKEKLLSFDEPTRFIFSHSALREGWDNPNVFVMCMLKHSDNTISRRQEVGRGLRLCVNHHGDRIDNPVVVHDINILTVVASESYTDFISGLQGEITEALSNRPSKANEEFFSGKLIDTVEGPIDITPVMAKQIYRYLLKNDYTDDTDQITDNWHDAKDTGSIVDLPDDLKPYTDQIIDLIDSVFDESKLPRIDDARKPKTNLLNSNFKKKEFKELWSRINQKTVYRVEFNSDELIERCIDKLDKQLRVTPLQYIMKKGIQMDSTNELIREGYSFNLTDTETELGVSTHSAVNYDLTGKIAEDTKLTRKTVATILHKIKPAVFQQFDQNPEHFISEVSRIVAEQKASMVIEHLAYDEIDEHYNIDIFTANQAGQDFSQATEKLKHHIYDYVMTDSDVERKFVKELDTSSEVVVYAKLPRGFLIPTPVGDYNPDWAISFTAGSVKHIYFIAETKGSMSSLELRKIEEAKIECAKKFFKKISQKVTNDRVKYDVITNYAQLMDLVVPTASST